MKHKIIEKLAEPNARVVILTDMATKVRYILNKIITDAGCVEITRNYERVVIKYPNNAELRILCAEGYHQITGTHFTNVFMDSGTWLNWREFEYLLSKLRAPTDSFAGELTINWFVLSELD